MRFLWPLLGIVLVVVAFGIFGDKGVVSIQGDQLGPDHQESRADYVQRANQSLERAQEPAYGLVSFRYPVTPAQAAAAVAGVLRVDAVIISAASPIPVPEPVAGSTREQVFSAAMDVHNLPGKITGLVVFDSPENLELVQARDGVLAVEMAPPDSAWGAFAVKPPVFLVQ